MHPNPSYTLVAACLVTFLVPLVHGQDEPRPAPPRSQGSGPSDDAIRLGPPQSLTEGNSREAMWPAPTAEDWKMPCLVPWERTFEDARKVAELTGKPILVCVNMDGEIASEHFAGIRYRRSV